VGSLLSHNIVAADAITIVDNASPDGSGKLLQQVLPDTHIVLSDANLGFGGGINLGFAESGGEYLMILNPDTYFTANSVAPVIGYMQGHDDVGLVGLDLIYPDGARQYSARRFYSALDVAARRVGILAALLKGRVDRHLMKDRWTAHAPFDAEWVMGTGFIIKHDLFRAIGRMDDRYFLYLEDLDLCARVWHAGKKVRCMPGAFLIHEHQRSSAKRWLGLNTRPGREHVRSLWLFARKFTLPLFRPPGIDAIVDAYSRHLAKDMYADEGVAAAPGTENIAENTKALIEA
jgi:GT2 family glycosyltransferase